MDYVPPINGNQADPDRPYINANPSTSTEGSIPPAEAIEHPMREIVAAIVLAGLTPNNADLTQLGQAIQALATGGDMYKADNLSGLADYAVARANLGVLQRKGTTIASAATTNIGAADSHFVSISGNNIITSLGTGTDRDLVMVEFTGTPTLTHHATNLPLPAGADIAVEAGDKAIFARRGSAGSAQWDLISYLRKSGRALITKLVNTGYVETTTDISLPTSSDIPKDDTPPLISEGVEILSIAYAAERVGNKIRLDVNAPLSAAGAANVGLAIFSGSTLIGAFYDDVRQNLTGSTVRGYVEITASSTSSVTYSVRMGVSSANGLLNGRGGSRVFGGASRAALGIIETR